MSSTDDDRDGPEGADMRSRILEVTVEAIDQGGEAAVRLSKVARAAGASPSIVAYYFGNREQLVAEAQAVRYLSGAPQDIENFAELVAAVQSHEDLRSVLITMFRLMLAEDRVARRARRVSALGAAMERPEVRDRLGAAQAQSTDRLAELIRLAQDQGLVRTDLDARAIAQSVIATIFGLVMIDIDSGPTDLDAVAAVIGECIAVLARPA